MNHRIHAMLAALAAAATIAPASVRADNADPGKAQPASEQATEQRLQEAQEKLQDAARQVADLSLLMSSDSGDPRALVFRFERRALLGMVIGTEPAPGSGGVRVLSVSPGGPADKAGVRANDVMVSLGGEPLDAQGKGTAPSRFVDIMRRAKPGEPIALEFRHDGKLVKAQAVPRQPDEGSLPLAMLPDFPGAGDPAVLVRREIRFAGDGFGGTELVELTPGLGAYFGTDKGLLVVRAPHDARFRLQDGDVLLDIDGRVPNGVGHAMQILGSYRPGEQVKLHVMRQKQRAELALEVPAG